MSNNMTTSTNFNLGDRVITTGYPAYHTGLESNVAPVGTIGTIIHIRHRYANTPNEYKQYKLKFEGYPEGDSLTHLYNSYDLELASAKSVKPQAKSSINVGDLVRVSGHPAYPSVGYANPKLNDTSLIEPGSIGRVLSIRHRYKGTPNENIQYKLGFNGMADGDSLTHLYESYSINRI